MKLINQQVRNSRWMWAGLAAALCAATAFGQGAEDLRLTIGKSIVIDYPSEIRQISLRAAELEFAFSLIDRNKP